MEGAAASPNLVQSAVRDIAQMQISGRCERVQGILFPGIPQAYRRWSELRERLRVGIRTDNWGTDLILSFAFLVAGIEG